MSNLSELPEYELLELLRNVIEEVGNRETAAHLCDGGLTKVAEISDAIDDYINFNENRNID